MTRVIVVVAALSTLAGNAAWAQVMDLSGQYRCVQGCRDGARQPAFVAQAGRELNLVNEAGELSRAWIDWVGHIWAPAWNEGAIYSQDGMVIQFDRGTVWEREGETSVAPPLVPAPVPPPVRAPSRRAAAPPAPERVAPARDAFDGSWSILVSTQSGACDPQYRFGVEIINGNILYGGGAAGEAQGRVAANGAVWVRVAAAGSEARGEGRLARTSGGGTWRGQGPAGTCAGIWQAVRRG